MVLFHIRGDERIAGSQSTIQISLYGHWRRAVRGGCVPPQGTHCRFSPDRNCHRRICSIISNGRPLRPLLPFEITGTSPLSAASLRLILSSPFTLVTFWDIEKEPRKILQEKSFIDFSPVYAISPIVIPGWEEYNRNTVYVDQVATIGYREKAADPKIRRLFFAQCSH